jgi:hypothetical protein
MMQRVARKDGRRRYASILYGTVRYGGRCSGFYLASARDSGDGACWRQATDDSVPKNAFELNRVRN